MNNQQKTQRKSISKKIRFEVFKRDKFTCQYCGAKAPDVVLNVDHIEPISKGGSNEILNLVTSCFECNNGKRDKKLEDNSVIEKQRRQLELLQERREQMELMIEWKKSLSTFDDDVHEMLYDYIHHKISPYTLNDNGKEGIKKLTKQFTTEQILNGIDESQSKYIKYEDEQATQESVEQFLKKLGGIIAYKNMPLIKQKAAYIKGIARNRFGYWDDRKGSQILNEYINALEEQGWEENRIVNDLENEVIPLTKEAKNWTAWRSQIEKWTTDINGWEKDTPEIHTKKELPLEWIEQNISNDIYSVKFTTDALIYIGKVFESFDSERFKEDMLRMMYSFMEAMELIYSIEEDYPENEEYYVHEFLEHYDILKHFEIPDFANSKNVLSHASLYTLRDSCTAILEKFLSEFYFPASVFTRTAIEICIKGFKKVFAQDPKQFFIE